MLHSIIKRIYCQGQYSQGEMRILFHLFISHHEIGTRGYNTSGTLLGIGITQIKDTKISRQ